MTADRNAALEAVAEAARNIMTGSIDKDDAPGVTLVNRYKAIELRRKLAALAAAPAGPEWRHKKRGTTYRVLDEANSQVVGEPIGEGDIVVVYRAESDGTLWIRKRDEFYDGRFERVE